jgi:DNA modification methylase
MATWRVDHGDCLDLLRAMPDCSVDSVCCDPPYGLSFMGKKWDYDVPAVEVWAECLRVLKPGGHLLAFAGTRTQHRMAVRIEDAGFEIRDMIAWVYGSGFPKSHNLKGDWKGWGTALKPAIEPITMARKPFPGTVAANVAEWGTGAVNVDGCRVGTSERMSHGGRQHTEVGYGGGTADDGSFATQQHPAGRWPSNLIHDGSEEVLAGFPGEGDKSAARFMYCPKASKADRDSGCEGLEERVITITEGHGRGNINTSKGDGTGLRENRPRRNTHATVKPTALMQYLCRLVTPPGGTVLDPFTGSGSTGKAAMLEGFSFIGLEREAEYVEIARRRIAEAAARPMLGGIN